MAALEKRQESNRSFKEVLKLKPNIRIRLPETRSVGKENGSTEISEGSWFGSGDKLYVPAEDFLQPSLAVSSGTPSLPHGWVARESRSKPGKFFYENTTTGKATWKKPKATPPPRRGFVRPITSSRPLHNIA